jgi:hypothetical protein
MYQFNCTRPLIIALSLWGVVVLYAPYLSENWSIAPWGDTIHLTGPLFCKISRSVTLSAGRCVQARSHLGLSALFIYAGCSVLDGQHDQ